jgi:hypothetical protein
MDLAVATGVACYGMDVNRTDRTVLLTSAADVAGCEACCSWRLAIWGSIGCQAVKHHAVKLLRNQEYRKELSQYDIETLWQQVDDVLDMVEENGMAS